MKPLLAMSLGCSAAVAACTLDSESLQPTALAGQECPAGQYMAGVGTDGHIICRQSINGFAGGAVTGTSSFDRVGIGTATPTEALHVRDGNVRFQGAGTQVSLERNSDSPAAHYLFFGKTRGSPAAPTPALDGDLLGSLGWLGWDGTDFQNGAYIQGFVDGAPSAGKFPASLKFVTTPAAAGLGAERMRITQAGYVGIGTTSPSYKLTVAEGDICITAPGNGLILKSPDGTKCRRIGIDNAGAITLTGIGICD